MRKMQKEIQFAQKIVTFTISKRFIEMALGRYCLYTFFTSLHFSGDIWKGLKPRKLQESKKCDRQHLQV